MAWSHGYFRGLKGKKRHIRFRLQLREFSYFDLHEKFQYLAWFHILRQDNENDTIPKNLKIPQKPLLYGLLRDFWCLMFVSLYRKIDVK